MKTNKHYVSLIDRQLEGFRQSRPLSAAQQAEVDKHQRVFGCRDGDAVGPDGVEESASNLFPADDF